MKAPSHGTRISSKDQPTLPQPLRVLSPNMSKTQRNQMKMAVIQMKIQKVHQKMFQKSDQKSMIVPFRSGDPSVASDCVPRHHLLQGIPGVRSGVGRCTTVVDDVGELAGSPSTSGVRLPPQDLLHRQHVDDEPERGVARDGPAALRAVPV